MTIKIPSKFLLDTLKELISVKGSETIDSHLQVAAKNFTKFSKQKTAHPAVTQDPVSLTTYNLSLLKDTHSFGDQFTSMNVVTGSDTVLVAGLSWLAGAQNDATLIPAFCAGVSVHVAREVPGATVKEVSLTVDDWAQQPNPESAEVGYVLWTVPESTNHVMLRFNVIRSSTQWLLVATYAWLHLDGLIRTLPAQASPQ